MKKLLLTCAMAMIALAGMAETTTKNYTDQLTVSVNGESSKQEATVIVEQLDESHINFVLSNFILVSGEESAYVGNIEINNLELTDEGVYKTFSYNDNLQIKPGNMEGVKEEDWLGPYLGDVPLVLKGKISDDKLYVTIDIDMQSTLGQTIYVTFGSEFTAISDVKASNTAKTAVFDLQGRRVSAANKGIYIIGGKKVLK